MGLIDDRDLWWRIRWHWVFFVVVVAGIAVGLLGKAIGLIPAAEGVFKVFIAFSKSLFILGGCIVGFAALVFAYEATKTLRETSDKLNSLTDLIKDNKDILTRINGDIRMSDSARQVAFREADRAGLREAVIERLHKHQFDDTEAMIKDIGRIPEFAELAKNLRQEVEKYKNASVDERAGQVITHIENLMEQYQWVKAAEQVERLCKAFPDSEKAQNMPKVLRENKGSRKKELLAAWDDAVKRQDTDKSLTILKELDLYLTPSEGLALQESAKDAFRTKLHNLGVQFSLEVADKQWDKAVGTGERIIREFPNSKMAVEIRSKMSVMENLAQK